MKKLIKYAVITVFVGLLSNFANSAVVPDFANNNYQNHELSRAEKKCLEDGYKITYANCNNQTAPADRCPSHDSYYRSCSQEQWCRNNNFSFLQSDCQLPEYPTKICPNQFPLYRSCQEDIGLSCEKAGYISKEKCKLSDKKCPYSKDYGICCGNCEGFSHLLSKVPEGYISNGETCITCKGIVKTNIKPAECTGFMDCEFGPFSDQTSSCLQGKKNLYSACKSAETVCKEHRFTNLSCSQTEDAEDCPYNKSLKKCATNCFKLAQSIYPQADIIASDIGNPVLDLTKKEIRSLVGLKHPDCQNLKRPTATIVLNESNFAQYQNIFERKIYDMTFNIDYKSPNSLPANGDFKNVKISFKGNPPPCPLLSSQTFTSGTVSFENAPTLCLNIKVADDSKLLSTNSIKGNIDLGKNSALGLKGDLIGYLKTKSYTNVFIKGKLDHEDLQNSTLDSESIVFGCNSKNKIVGGINANTSSVIVKAWAKLDTPNIVLTSTSNEISLPNSLGSIHLHKHANLFSTYGNDEETAIFPLVENGGDRNCEDKHYIHMGSAVDNAKQTATLEPSNRWEDRWECKKLSIKQQSCD